MYFSITKKIAGDIHVGSEHSIDFIVLTFWVALNENVHIVGRVKG